MSLACFIAPIHSLISRLRPLLAPLPPSPPCLPLGISLCSLRNFHILQPGAASISSSLVVPPNLGTVPALSQGPHSLPLLTIPVLLQALPLSPTPPPPLIKRLEIGYSHIGNVTGAKGPAGVCTTQPRGSRATSRRRRQPSGCHGPANR